MSENRNNRLPAGLIWLLIYQSALVLISLCFIVAFSAELIEYGEWPAVLYILPLICWGATMCYASVGMMRRNPRGFFLAAICHLLFAILSLSGLISLFSIGILAASGGHESRGWAPLFLLFALMWLPFVWLSGWGFFYLRRLRKGMEGDCR